MRLDARQGDTGWPCYDAKRCRMVENVLWVDDQTARWGEMKTIYWDVEHQEERITIYPSRRLVIFNQVDDSHDAGEQVADAVTRLLETT
jgi:hypothetical protein